MLTLDLAAWSREELQEAVRKLCSQFGSVTNVVIIKDGGRHGFALAAVEMATAAETLEVLQHFGDYKVDPMAVIRIEQSVSRPRSSP